VREFVLLLFACHGSLNLRYYLADFYFLWAEIIELLDSPQPQQADGPRRRHARPQPRRQTGGRRRPHPELITGVPRRRQARPQPRQVGGRRCPQPELIVLSSDSEKDAPPRPPRQTGGRRHPQPELIVLSSGDSADDDSDGDNSRKRTPVAPSADAKPLPFQLTEYIRFHLLINILYFILFLPFLSSDCAINRISFNRTTWNF
jgi:hypothetical protein